MTDTNETPQANPAEMPTTPLPTSPEAAPAADAIPPTDPTAPLYPAQPQYAAQPPTAPHHGLHVAHKVSEGAIAVMVIGALLFGILAFGAGWTARSISSRFQTQRGAMMGQGYGVGQGYGQDQGALPPGHPDIGGNGQGGGMMRGGRGNSQQGQGWNQQDSQGQTQGQGQSGGWGTAPGQSAPAPGSGY
jgi:hypothetical protein